MQRISQAEAAKLLLAALDILWERTDAKHALSKPELAQALEARGFEADWRAVWRLLDAAREAGIDVVRPERTAPASAGYALLSRPFEPWQIGFLLDCVETSAMLAPEEKASMKAALLKLLPERERTRSLREIATGFHAKPLYSGKVSENMAILTEAIASKRRVCFNYWEVGAAGSPVKRGARDVRVVEPYAFIYRNESYYLLAGKVEGASVEQRTYRVDRIEGVRPLNDMQISSLSKLGINPERALAESFGMFLDSEAVEVHLVFETRFAKYVAERFDASVIRPRNEGVSEAVVRVRLSQAFYGWVFQFGGRMAIAGPDEICRGYRKMLTTVCERQRMLEDDGVLEVMPPDD